MIEERVGWTLEDMRHMLRWGHGHARKIRAHLFRTGTTSSGKDEPNSMNRLTSKLSGLFKVQAVLGGVFKGCAEMVLVSLGHGSFSSNAIEASRTEWLNEPGFC